MNPLSPRYSRVQPLHFIVLWTLGIFISSTLRAELFYVEVGNFSVTGGAIVAADYNGDGRLDLATTAIDVLLGDGTGSFGENLPTPITQNVGRPRAMVATDFNRDGILDLAVTTINEFLAPNDVSVLLGAGNGSFGEETLFGVGTEPLSLATGDFNGDLVPDLVTANRFSDDISVLLGTGTGSFEASTEFATNGFQERAVGVGELNDDDHMDIVAANAGSGDVSVFLGNGTGSFASPTKYPASAPGSIALADLNNDGFLDIGVTSHPNSVSILMGNGDGTFDAPQVVQVGQFTSRLDFAHLDQDQNMDLVVSKFFNGGLGNNEVIALLGNGDGSFGAPIAIFRQSNDAIRVIPFEIADFNEDGAEDFAFGKSADFSGQFISILLNADPDGDNIPSTTDNCPLTKNKAQVDNDQDEQGDPCDDDDDNDGVEDSTDNCPLIANADQSDRDQNGRGDVCDDEFCFPLVTPEKNVVIICF